MDKYRLGKNETVCASAGSPPRRPDPPSNIVGTYRITGRGGAASRPRPIEDPQKPSAVVALQKRIWKRKHKAPKPVVAPSGSVPQPLPNGSSTARWLAECNRIEASGSGSVPRLVSPKPPPTPTPNTAFLGMRPDTPSAVYGMTVVDSNPPTLPKIDTNIPLPTSLYSASKRNQATKRSSLAIAHLESLTSLFRPSPPGPNCNATSFSQQSASTTSDFDHSSCADDLSYSWAESKASSPTSTRHSSGPTSPITFASPITAETPTRSSSPAPVSSHTSPPQSTPFSRGLNPHTCQGNYSEESTACEHGHASLNPSAMLHLQPPFKLSDHSSSEDPDQVAAVNPTCNNDAVDDRGGPTESEAVVQEPRNLQSSGSTSSVSTSASFQRRPETPFGCWGEEVSSLNQWSSPSASQEDDIVVITRSIPEPATSVWSGEWNSNLTHVIQALRLLK